MRQQKLPLSTFPIISQWKLSCHSNQSSYRIGTKKQLFNPLPIDAICEIWKESASEEKLFENVDRRRPIL